MRLRPWLVALVVFVASCGTSAARVSSGLSARACGPASARTIAANGQVRVYARGGIVFGCSVARGRSFRLGHATRSVAEAVVAPVAVAGDLVAYGVRHFGVDTVRATVVVRRLTDGKVLKELAATRAVGAESFQKIWSVVVRAGGAVAWIGSENSIGGRRGAIEVHAAGAGGDRVLDSNANPQTLDSTAIDPTSLRLHGATLSWVHAGVTRHATLR